MRPYAWIILESLFFFVEYNVFESLEAKTMVFYKNKRKQFEIWRGSLPMMPLCLDPNGISVCCLFCFVEYHGVESLGSPLIGPQAWILGATAEIEGNRP